MKGWTLLSCAVCVLLSCAVQAEEPELLSTEASQELFETKCLSCHSGEMMYTWTGPVLLSIEWDEEKAEKARKIIHDGSENLHMQAFGDDLTDQQIESLVIFLRDTSVPDPEKAKGGGYLNQW